MNFDIDTVPDDLRVRFYRSSRFQISPLDFPAMFRRPFTLIATVEKGFVDTGYDRQNHQVMTLKEGDVYVCPANIWRHSRSNRGVILEASFMFEIKGGMDLLTFAGKPFFIKGKAGERMKTLLQELLDSEKKPDDRSLLARSVSRQRFGYAILDCIFSEYIPDQEILSARRIFPVLEYMDNTFFKTLDIKKIVRLSGYSRTHFFRVFKALTGKTPTEFQKQRRLREAMLLLQESDKTVAEVAYTVGWNNPFYFSKLFKKEVGLPPSEYRNCHWG